MEPERLDGFLGGYVAGFVDAVTLHGSEDAHNHMGAQVGLEQAEEALEVQGTACLACGREGVVILDGYFCESCAPGLADAHRREGR